MLGKLGSQSSINHRLAEGAHSAERGREEALEVLERDRSATCRSCEEGLPCSGIGERDHEQHQAPRDGHPAAVEWS